MKNLLFTVTFLFLISCNSEKQKNNKSSMIEKLNNQVTQLEVEIESIKEKGEIASNLTEKRLKRLAKQKDKLIRQITKLKKASEKEIEKQIKEASEVYDDWLKEKEKLIKK